MAQRTMKILYKSTLLALLLSLCSCNFLDVDLQGATTEENYYQNVEQLQEALNGVYAVLNDGNLYADAMLGRMGLSADLGYEYYKKDANTVGYYQASTGDVRIQGFWRACYVGINRANMLLENIDRAEGVQKEKDRIKGEALFMRGYYYYMLVKRFGRVPVVLKSIDDINSADKFVPQSEIAQVYEQIMQDMTEAADLVLPTTASSEGWQVCQTTCWGMLARVALNMAGYPANRTEMYAVAAQWAKKVIDSGLHALNPSYEQIFINYAQDVFDIKESMFEVNFWGDNSGVYSTAGMVGRNIGIASDENSPIGFCQGMLRVNPYFYYLYEASDLRRDWTISPFNYTGSGEKSYNAAPEDGDILSRRYCAKFRREYEISTTKNLSYTAINFPILRYSDVLLMYAECYAFDPSSADRTLAYEYLNQVRRRGYGKDIAVAAPDVDIADMGNEELKQVIYDERAREFGYEMLRKDDLTRWGILYPQMQLAGSYIEGRSTQYQMAAMTAYESVRQRDDFWPIPAREISVNNKLVQNTGW